MVGAMIGMAVVQGLAGFFGSRAKANNMRRDAQESIRRQSLADEAKVSQTTAMGAASGVEMGSGSLRVYLKTMQDEMARQRLYAYRAQNNAADDIEAAGLISGFTDVGKGLFQAGQSANWGQQPNNQVIT